MTIRVKFFAKLREDLCKESVELDIQQPLAASDVWANATGRPLPADVFCAINHEHAHLHQMVHDKDEVAFFPRITGG